MRVLLIGVGPLPFYQTDRNSGIAYGTWQLCRAMLAAGHTVDAITMEHGCFTAPRVTYRHRPDAFGALTHHPLPETRAETLDEIAQTAQELLESIRPDCIVSAGSPIASFVTTRLETTLPIWFDLFGEVMAEVQAKAALTDDHVLPIILDLMQRILQRGDRFSAVSERQRLVVIGQLSMLGRLNGANAALGVKLVQTIPAGIDTGDRYVHDQTVIRGVLTPRSAFVVLWSGGFNTWADLDTLFHGLDAAMQLNPDIHFVATGGAIAGHHESGFAQFRERTARSPHSNRYHFVGWVPQDAVHNYFLESDVGINCDLDILESEIGTRTRVLPWFKAGLPPVMTRATELSQLVDREQLGFVVPMGSPDALTRVLLRCAEQRDEVRCRGRRAQFYAYKRLGFNDVCAPLLDWLKHPAPAPDRARGEDRIVRAVQITRQTELLGRVGKGELPTALIQEKQRPWWRRYF